MLDIRRKISVCAAEIYTIGRAKIGKYLPISPNFVQITQFEQKVSFIFTYRLYNLKGCKISIKIKMRFMEE